MKQQPDINLPKRKLTRREILRGAAAAATAPYVLTSGALGAPGLAPASDRLTVACVGIRNKGGGHLKSLLANGDVQVVSVCDVDRTIRGRAANRVAGTCASRLRTAQAAAPAATGDYREIAARRDIDAVVIATPDHTHAVIAMEMLRGQRNVYIEKPIALTIAEGRAIADAAAASKLVVQVGCQKRANPKYRLARDLIRRGAIGQLVGIETRISRRPTAPTGWSPQPVPAGLDYETWLGPAPLAPYTPARCHYNWRFIRDYSAGELAGQAFHGLDLAQWAMGADAGGPIAVEGSGEYYRTGLYDTFYRVDVQWTYANGVRLTCRTAPSAAMRFIGTHGWFEPDTMKASSPPILNEATKTLPGLSHMRNFLAAVRAGRPEDASTNAEAGHRSATVCHLGEIAMRLGRPLQWDPTSECFPNDDEAQSCTRRPYRQPWTL